MDETLQRIPKKCWQRMRTGHGLKGDRHYDWSMVQVDADDTPAGHRDGHSFLLIRRHRSTGRHDYFRCHSAAPVTLAELVHVVCTRWHVEEDFQTAKNVAGLDQGQVTCWKSWHRWSPLSLITTAVLTLATILHPAGPRPSTPPNKPRKDGMIALTRNEIFRLLRQFALPEPTQDDAHVLHWSRWRRRHQHQAAACHRHWNHVTAETTT
ncbi:hypothetical protein ACPCTO_38185 [Streptomyces olivoreticuli]